jgi:DNA-binding transcriptional MerR regulator
MRRRKTHRDASTFRYKPKKRPKKSKSERKKLNAYAKFVRSHRGMGLTLKEIAKLYRKHKRETASHRHSTHTRKGKTMAKHRPSRALPKELLDLARALKEASREEPGAPGPTELVRRMEKLVRNVRAEQRKAERASRKAKEDEEIWAQAKEWASKGPPGTSGDPGRRRSRKKSAAAKRRRRALKALHARRYGHRRPR